MCGVAGAVETARGSSRDALTRVGWAMAGCLQHRGPDDGGVWTEPERGVVLAHRRLAVIDLSPSGAQPMVSASGRFVLVFNGEIYNFASLRRTLLAGGTRLRGGSDTEVLLELMAREGAVPALQQCRGMFALALLDRQERTLTLARDRFGEKPLYYGWSRGTFLFASECTAMRAHPDFDDEIDRDAVAGLLRHSYVPAPRSIFRGASKLLPGTTVRIELDRPGSATSTTYWSLAEVAQQGQQVPFAGTDEDAVDAVEDAVTAAVSEAMVADVPVGAFLSGGVDSSTVVALMQRSSSERVRTYTVGFEDPAYDESPYGDAVAQHLGTTHTALQVTPAEARAVIPDLPGTYDEPFADASQIPTTLVSRLARQQVTVALSGDGGDEHFGGYERYAVADRRWKAVARVPLPARRLAAQAAARGHRGERIARMLSAGRPEELYQMLLTHWHDPAAVVLGAGPADALPDASALPPTALRYMLQDALQYLPDAVLVKVDRAAMSTSLETRVPLLDPRVVALAWSLPLRLRTGGSGRADKVALRSVLHRHVPRALVDRPKMGFGVPVGTWLRGPLREWGEDLLSDSALRRTGLLEPAPVRAAWADHQSGRRNADQQLWNVLMLQAWVEHGAGQAVSARAAADVAVEGGR